MFAIHDSAEETITDEYHAKKITEGCGYSVNVLMRKLVDKE